MASTETERVYEQRVDELLQQVRELQDRGEDVESVAQQLKQLEELVQELEEGLEDARRGEAEARGEVEFLRGEVERGRSELRREKERAAGTSSRDSPEDDESRRNSLRDLEQRDDEIRGLKAIIHSLSRDSMVSRPGTSSNGTVNGYGHEVNEEKAISLERQVKELEAVIEQKTYREEELESEIDRLRGAPHPRLQDKHKSTGTVRSHRLSDRTVVPGEFREQISAPLPVLETMHEADSRSTVTDESTLWCEICETGGHDILTCSNMFGNQQGWKESTGHTPQRTGKDVVAEGLKGLGPARQSHEGDRPAPLASRKNTVEIAVPAVGGLVLNPMDHGMVAGKRSGIIDEMRWCALCERDGHESVDCPFEETL